MENTIPNAVALVVEKLKARFAMEPDVGKRIEIANGELTSFVADSLPGDRSMEMIALFQAVVLRVALPVTIDGAIADSFAQPNWEQRVTDMLTEFTAEAQTLSLI